MRYLTALDIGSQTIKGAVVKLNSGKKPLEILAMVEVEGEGIRKGVVVNIEEAANSLFKLSESLSQISGVRAREAYVGVGDPQMTRRDCRGMIIVSRADSEISDEDVKRVYQAAESLNPPQNKEILHIVPKEFIVDGEAGIKNPVGMKGLKLETNALIIEGFSPFVKNLNKAVELAGFYSQGLIFSPLAAARAVLTKRQKELGVIVLDIGSTNSGLVVYRDGEIVSAQIFPVGSAHITNDIAVNFKIQIELAEKMKVEYGAAMPNLISKKEIIDFESLGISNLRVSRKNLSNIINKRLKEIFRLVSKELNSIEKNMKLPGGLILTGGGSKMPLIVDLAKKEFKMPAQIGFPSGIAGLIEKVDDPTHASLVGLLLWGIDMKRGFGSQGFMTSFDYGPAGFFKKVFKNILP